MGIVYKYKIINFSQKNLFLKRKKKILSVATTEVLQSGKDQHKSKSQLTASIFFLSGLNLASFTDFRKDIKLFINHELRHDNDDNNNKRLKNLVQSICFRQG